MTEPVQPIEPTKEQIDEYNKRVVSLTKDAPKYILHPFEYKDLFLALLDEGSSRGIISYSFAEKKKTELIYRMNTPSRAKEWIKNQMIRARNKIFKKKLLLKENKSIKQIHQTNPK